MIDLGTPSHYALLGVSPTASAAEIRAARDAEVKRLREQAQQESSPERRAELAERQQTINAAGEVLVRPAEREKYDREHPDLRLLARRPATAPLFTDPAERVGVLYRALLDHLAGREAWSRPPSDLVRTDFRADESPNTLLDDLIAQRRH